MDLVAGLMLVPFVGGGVYALSRRFRHHDEWPLAAEAATLAAVAIFFAVEVALLRTALPQNPVFLMFSVLGLAAAGAALYGHVLVSLASRLVVGVVVHNEERNDDRPRFGPAESLERQGAFAEALQEYLVLARIYPREAEVHARIAEIYLRLAQPADAATWWRRALKYAGNAGDILAFTQRLCETHERHLKDSQGAQAVLEAFLTRYPDSPDAGLVRERLERLQAPVTLAPRSAALVELEAAPMEAEPEVETPRSRIAVGLAPMEDTVLPDDADAYPAAIPVVPEQAKPRLPALDALEENTLEPAPEPPRRPVRGRSTLEALDDAPLDPEV